MKVFEEGCGEETFFKKFLPAKRKFSKEKNNVRH